MLVLAAGVSIWLDSVVTSNSSPLAHTTTAPTAPPPPPTDPLIRGPSLLTEKSSVLSAFKNVRCEIVPFLPELAGVELREEKAEEEQEGAIFERTRKADSSSSSERLARVGILACRLLLYRNFHLFLIRRWRREEKNNGQIKK